MKILHTVCPYGLNERTKFMNKFTFSPLPRYGERFIDTRTWSRITNHDLSSDIEIRFNLLKHFTVKYCNSECRKLLESFKNTELKLLRRRAQNLQYNNFFMA